MQWFQRKKSKGEDEDEDEDASENDENNEFDLLTDFTLEEKLKLLN